MPKIPTVIGDPKTGWSEWQRDDTKDGELFIYCCSCALCHEWQFRISSDGLLQPEYRVRVDERKTAAARREAIKAVKRRKRRRK